VSASGFPRRQILGSAAALAGGALLGGAAITAPARPARADDVHIYTRADWGAVPPTSPATILDHGPDHIVVHHTASANTTDYSQDAAYSLSRAIQDLHMNTNGWSDTGQQLTISRGGFVMEGRNRTLESLADKLLVEGAQTLGQNDHTIGIENEGTYITATPTTALWNSLVATCSYLCTLYGLDPQTAIVGHRDYVNTQCPGDAFYAQLPQLRNDVAGTLGQPRRAVARPSRVRTNLPAPRGRFDHGPAVAPGELKP
jgi:hypothetical protein